jgi:hypothetical protein
MADPYLPQQPGSYEQPRNLRDPALAQPTRPIPVVDEPRSGFGTGMLVVLVFVVVGILAAVFLRPVTPDIDATTPAVEEEPALEMVPVEPDAGTAPVDPAVDPAVEPEAVQPDAGTAEPATPPASGSTSP